jgi:hypothetical protein
MDLRESQKKFLSFLSFPPSYVKGMRFVLWLVLLALLLVFVRGKDEPAGGGPGPAVADDDAEKAKAAAEKAKEDADAAKAAAGHKDKYSDDVDPNTGNLPDAKTPMKPINGS